jgi:hypothetical protein
MANRIISDLLGTALSALQIGISSTALRLKNVAGVLRVRNKADSADAALVASKLSASGDDIELNEDAAGSGADWLYTLRRPSTGMTGSVILTLPVDDGSPAQALLSDGSGNLYWATIAGGADKPVFDTTTVGFGASSPVAMFTKPANAVSLTCRIIVDTAFDGTPSMSIGIAGDTSKFVPSTAIDLTTAGIYEFDVSAVASVGTTEDVIATYSAGSASVGSARIIYAYVIPS